MHKKMLFAVCVVLVLIMIAGSAYFLIPDDYALYDKITNHIYDFNSLIVVLTVFAAWHAIGRTDKKRTCWFLMIVGVCGWFLGDLTWTLMIYLEVDPLPSPADIFYIIGYIGVFAAVLTKYLAVRHLAEFKDKANGAFVGFVMLAVVGYAVLLPIAVSDYNLLNKVIVITYPILDTLIIALAVTIISAMHANRNAYPWFFVCAGLTMWIVADTFTAYFEWNGVDTAAHWVDILFLTGIHFIGLGAFYRRLIAKGEVKIGDSQKGLSAAATSS
jgi:hypothetical protein